jgi:hypothetical protein
MKKTKIKSSALITGSSGGVGSNLCKEHRQIYPDIKYNKKVILIVKILKYIIRRENINLNNLSALVLGL